MAGARQRRRTVCLGVPKHRRGSRYLHRSTAPLLAPIRQEHHRLLGRSSLPSHPPSSHPVSHLSQARRHRFHHCPGRSAARLFPVFHHVQVPQLLRRDQGVVARGLQEQCVRAFGLLRAAAAAAAGQEWARGLVQVAVVGKAMTGDKKRLLSSVPWWRPRSRCGWHGDDWRQDACAVVGSCSTSSGRACGSW